MDKRYRLYAVIIVLSFAILACSVLSGGDSSSESSNVLFKDDFSSSNSGWDQVRADDGITDYENGVYRINVLVPDTDVWANPGLDFTDTQVEVDATKVGGPDDNDFGIICRYQDTDNYYYFIISSDGYYGIGKVVDGEYNLIGMDSMPPSEAINQGADTNHLRADCIGNTLTLYVNGEELDSKEDNEFTSGDVGLLAGTYTESGTDIHFDDFYVYKP